MAASENTDEGDKVREMETLERGTSSAKVAACLKLVVMRE